jgi:hypothetical protein
MAEINDTNKIAEKLPRGPWHHRMTTGTGDCHICSPDGLVAVLPFGKGTPESRAAVRDFIINARASIGLTVPDDAGALAKARELLREAGALGAVIKIEIRNMSLTCRDAEGREWILRSVTQSKVRLIEQAIDLMLKAISSPQPAPSTDDAGVLRYALVKVRAHVGRLPGASRELLNGLLDSIDRISAEALQTTPVSAPQPAPSTDDHPEPTAETRGDEGFEAWWRENGVSLWSSEWNSVIDLRPASLTSWKAARADLLAKVAGVRGQIRKLYVHSGPAAKWDLVSSILDAAFPSDPSDPGEKTDHTKETGQ